MPLDSGGRMAREFGPVEWGKVPGTLSTPPVLLGDPRTRLIPVPTECPPAEELVREKVQFRKAPFRGPRAKVLSPTSNNRGQMSDEHRLGDGAVAVDDGAESLEVTSQGGGAGLGEGFEAEGDGGSTSTADGSGVGLAHGELADPEAQEVEAGSLIRVDPQGMADAGFAGVELQADLPQPGRRLLRDLFDDAQVGMHDDEVVGIAHDQGLPAKVEARGGDRGLQRGLETVQGDVGEQWAHYATLRSARVGGKEGGTVHHAGREPGAHRPPEGGEGSESGEKHGLIDAVETLGDVRIQHILGLATDGAKDGFDGAGGCLGT